jgi:hypothetical protein
MVVLKFVPKGNKKMSDTSMQTWFLLFRQYRTAANKPTWFTRLVETGKPDTGVKAVDKSILEAYNAFTA